MGCEHGSYDREPCISASYQFQFLIQEIANTLRVTEIRRRRWKSVELLVVSRSLVKAFDNGLSVAVHHPWLNTFPLNDYGQSKIQSLSFLIFDVCNFTISVTIRIFFFRYLIHFFVKGRTWTNGYVNIYINCMHKIMLYKMQMLNDLYILFKWNNMESWRKYCDLANTFS